MEREADWKIDWDTLLGQGVSPVVDFHTHFDSAARFRVTPQTAIRENTPEMAESLQAILEPNEAVWRREEWEQMIGLAEVDWRRRILLICRAQAEALRLSDERQLGKEVKKNRFIEMLDHELFSTRLLWPRRVSVETEEKGSSRRMTANPLIRFPESVVLCALRDVLADADGKAMGPPRGLQDEAAGPVRWDRTQLAALNKWFEDRGARLGETITAGHVSNYREKKLGQRTVGSLLATVALARNGTREYPRRNGSW